MEGPLRAQGQELRGVNSLQKKDHSQYDNGGTKVMGQTEPQFLSDPMSDRKKVSPTLCGGSSDPGVKFS
jgi:hypothetical protein